MWKKNSIQQSINFKYNNQGPSAFYAGRNRGRMMAVLHSINVFIEERMGLKYGVLFSIRVYQRFVAIMLPRACRFYPSCSMYMYESIEKKGLLPGAYRGVRRLLKCHPFHPGGYDPP